MTPSKPPEGDASNLYEKLEQTPEVPLSMAVGGAEGLTPEEEERLDRGENHETRKAFRRALRRVIGFGGWSLGFVLLALCILLIVILAIYAKEIVDEGATSDVVGAIVAYIFGVASTIAVEQFVRK